MKRIIIPLAVLGALAIAAPASAQIVNGVNNPAYAPLPEAPIATKGGGNSPSSLAAPGEAAAVAGAIKNNAEAKAGRPLPNGATDGQYNTQAHNDQTEGR